jgi:hypothetical protein
LFTIHPCIIELENILEHEKVHSEQHHTGTFYFRGYFCFGSINSMALQKAIIQNLEFIADKSRKNITDKKSLSANPFEDNY